MNRRQVFLHSLLGLGATLTTSKTAHALNKNIITGPSRNGEIQLTGLPPGMVEIEPVIELPDGSTESAGDVIEIYVADSGKATFNYRPSTLLSGLWQVYKPGATITNKLEPRRPFYDGHLPGTFELFDSYITGAQTACWMYRNPSSYPGSELRGIDQSTMTLWVNSGSKFISTLNIQLVDLELAPNTYQDLQRIPFSAFPPVRDVLQEWIFPPGRGSRSLTMHPFKIPWNARWLALRRIQKVSEVHIRLMSLPAGSKTPPEGQFNIGLLEIGWSDRPTPS